MISQLMSYGGISAKVRAMYGKRLTSSDYASLSTFKTVSEIVSYLKEHPGWKDSLSSINPAYIHRAELEEAIRTGSQNEVIRIYKFMSREDHPLLNMFIERSETQEILSFIRCFNAEAPWRYVCALPEYFSRRSSVDYLKLKTVTSFEQFLSLISQSPYYPPLSRLPRKAGKAPDYTLTDTVLESTYFSRLFDLIEKKYTGDAETTLRSGLGVEVDLINIVSIIRIKKYFPEMNNEIISYIIPFNHRLSASFMQRLCAAPTVEAAYKLLEQSAYKKLFLENDFERIDDYSAKHMYDFNKRMLSAPVPSVYTPIAYINLKSAEVRNLINVIECVRYGITLEEAGVYLVGID